MKQLNAGVRSSGSKTVAGKDLNNLTSTGWPEVKCYRDARNMLPEGKTKRKKTQKPSNIVVVDDLRVLEDNFAKPTGSMLGSPLYHLTCGQPILTARRVVQVFIIISHEIK